MSSFQKYGHLKNFAKKSVVAYEKIRVKTTIENVQAKRENSIGHSQNKILI